MIETVSLFQDGSLSSNFPYIFDSNALDALRQSMHRLGCKRRYTGIHRDYDKIVLAILDGRIPYVPMTLDAYVEFYVKAWNAHHRKRIKDTIFFELVRSDSARFVLLDIPKEEFGKHPYSLVDADREDISNTIAAACVRLDDVSDDQQISVITNDRHINDLRKWYKANSYSYASRFRVVSTREFVRELRL